jgi:acyl-CoA thioesterase-1
VTGRARRSGRRSAAALVFAPVLALAAGCGGRGPLVAFLGDSLTSGWRLPESEAWPARLGEDLRRRGHAVRVLNAGVSGETAAEGLARLDGVLGRRPDVLVVALGINDGLRGLPVADTEAALRAILDRARAAGVPVLLVGMRIAPDDERARRFNDLYPRLAAELRLPWVPDLRAPVVGRPELLFPDGLHPNAAGHERLAEAVRPVLEQLLAERDAARRRRAAGSF